VEYLVSADLTTCLILFGLLLFSRGADFLSTWIATPNLVLEANPIARRLGWRGSLLVNLLVCLLFAVLPIPAIMIITTSLLVASRNFELAWLMRSMGEDAYRYWLVGRLAEASRGVYIFCVVSQSLLTGVIGVALVVYGPPQAVPFAIGLGIITYSLTVAVYTLIAARNIPRSQV
jgi:hypothetical protein